MFFFITSCFDGFVFIFFSSYVCYHFAFFIIFCYFWEGCDSTSTAKNATAHASQKVGGRLFKIQYHLQLVFVPRRIHPSLAPTSSSSSSCAQFLNRLPYVACSLAERWDFPYHIRQFLGFTNSYRSVRFFLSYLRFVGSPMLSRGNR